ncbi:MAG: SPOR domain-containing protein [Spirochaetes bacterium]|jgi:hypothetical protein|nr:SPOR domain-containing protein [Spirochaetota bacterium]
MQNIDFHDGRNFRNLNTQFEFQDADFSRISPQTEKDEEKNRKKASRMMFLIVALCIISFTAGLIFGLKIAGGANKEIMDPHTKNAVANVGKKLSGMMSSGAVKQQGNIFPKDEYPYVIKIGGEFDGAKSQEIASYLSKKGHTVIISNHNDLQRLFTGPYKTQDEAQSYLKKISRYRDFSLASSLRILKR